MFFRLLFLLNIIVGNKDMKIGSGIAIAGMWVGVGISSFGAGPACVGVAVMAMLATCGVVFSELRIKENRQGN